MGCNRAPAAFSCFSIFSKGDNWAGLGIQVSGCWLLAPGSGILDTWLLIFQEHLAIIIIIIIIIQLAAAEITACDSISLALPLRVN